MQNLPIVAAGMAHRVRQQIGCFLSQNVYNRVRITPYGLTVIIDNSRKTDRP